MKVAALDLGSNSFLCLIADVENGKIKKTYQDQVQVVRLGQGVNATKQFHPDALIRAENCLKKFSETIEKEKPDVVLAVATAAARIATNKEDFFSIGKKLNIPIKIIPGELEAQITFQGAISGIANNENGNQKYIVVDVGGASTEIILGDNNKIIISESCKIGCVSFTEKYFKNTLPSNEEIKNALIDIKSQSKNIIHKISENLNIENETVTVIAVAGTPTTLAAIELGAFDVSKVDGYKLSLTKLEYWQKEFSSIGSEKISEQYKVEKGRADVITMGTLILKSVLEDLNCNSLQVSTRGVRYGVALGIESGLLS